MTTHWTSPPTKTGRRRFRTERAVFPWRTDCLVLQVELQGHVALRIGGHVDVQEARRWRDARIEDLTAHDELK
jgi:hypothetical protein